MKTLNVNKIRQELSNAMKEQDWDYLELHKNDDIENKLVKRTLEEDEEGFACKYVTVYKPNADDKEDSDIYEIKMTIEIKGR